MVYNDEMLRAIQAVHSGEAIFSAAIADGMMNFFTASRAVVPQETFHDLTEREREILVLII